MREAVRERRREWKKEELRETQGKNKGGSSVIKGESGKKRERGKGRKIGVREES